MDYNRLPADHYFLMPVVYMQQINFILREKHYLFGVVFCLFVFIKKNKILFISSQKPMISVSAWEGVA